MRQDLHVYLDIDIILKSFIKINKRTLKDNTRL